MEYIKNKWRHYNDSYPMFLEIFSTAVAFLALVIIFAILSDVFFTFRNVINVLRRASIYLIMCTGMTFCIGSAGIDISTESILGVCTAILGISIMVWGLPVSAGILLAIITGFVLGLFNAAVITVLKVPPIITTLGTWTAYRGIAFVLLGGDIHYGFPDSFVWMGQGFVGVIPAPIIIASVVVIAGLYVLNFTRTGTYIKAVGGNEAAAQAAGINTWFYKGLTYTIVGVLAALAAVIATARVDAAQAVMGQGMSLHVIASVVIGGTSIFGGRATMIGTILGVLILGVLENGLLLAGFSHFWQLIALGLVTIVAVAVRTARQKTSEDLI